MRRIDINTAKPLFDYFLRKWQIKTISKATPLPKRPLFDRSH